MWAPSPVASEYKRTFKFQSPQCSGESVSKESTSERRVFGGFVCRHSFTLGSSTVRRSNPVLRPDPHRPHIFSDSRGSCGRTTPSRKGSWSTKGVVGHGDPSCSACFTLTSDGLTLNRPRPSSDPTVLTTLRPFKTRPTPSRVWSTGVLRFRIPRLTPSRVVPLDTGSDESFVCGSPARNRTERERPGDSGAYNRV